MENKKLNKKEIEDHIDKMAIFNIKDPVNYPTVLKIATRAEKLLGLAKINFALDIQAVKADINWEMLLAANDFNFIHDIAGINKHLDRDTGELKNFIPFYAL